MGGFEPPSFRRRILSPLCMPFHHIRIFMVQKNNTAPCRRSAYREPVYRACLSSLFIRCFLNYKQNGKNVKHIMQTMHSADVQAQRKRFIFPPKVPPGYPPHRSKQDAGDKDIFLCHCVMLHRLEQALYQGRFQFRRSCPCPFCRRS